MAKRSANRSGRDFRNGLATGICLLVALTLTAPPARTAEPATVAADRWVTNGYRFPTEPGRTEIQVDAGTFASLRSEVRAEQLRAIWTPHLLTSNRPPSLLISTADLGHWPARDWRRLEMTPAGADWEAVIPVEDPDIAIAYFVRTGESPILQSPMRSVLPRRAGLEEPTKLFWSFLEGFEEGMGSWRTLTPTPGGRSVQADSTARTGHFALTAAIPPGRASTTIATTRVRGWQIVSQQASGIRVWIRTRTGTGQVRFSLLAHAETPSQRILPWPAQVTITDQWTKLDLPLRQLDALSLASVDLLAFEFLGNSGQEFLIDDLELLGRWKAERE